MADFDLLNDPMPHLNRDAHKWPVIFRNVYKLNMDKRKAVTLHKLLWRTRKMGTEVIQTHIDTKLVPVYLPVGYWEDELQFDEMKQILKPYAKEIKELLRGDWNG